jgi:hypothetical protein
MVSTFCTVHSVTRRAVFHIYVFTDPINKQTMNKCVFTRKRFQIILFDFKPHLLYIASMLLECTFSP